MEALGLDLKLLIAQIVNFLIVLFLLRKFAYKPVISILEKRATLISEGVDNAHKAEKSLQEATHSKKEILDQAYLEAEKILAEAKTEAADKATTIVKNANLEADKILDKAKTEAATEKDRALIGAKREIGDLLLLSLDKIVGHDLDSAQKQKITASAIKEL